MPKLRDIILVAVFALFVSGPILLDTAQNAMGDDMPRWLTAKEADRLAGSHQTADVAGNLSLEGFASGHLQDAWETEIDNAIPAKANAMLANAAAQRAAIQLANAPFNWGCYPTYLGADRLFVPDANAVTYLPDKQDADSTERLASFARGVAQVAQRFPDKRFIIYAVGGLHTPAVCPANELVANCYTPSVVYGIMHDAVAQVGASNVSVLYDDYHDGGLDEYYRNFWRTDHHWNPSGAARAYNAMAATLGNPPFVPGELVRAVGGPFIGRTSVNSLDMVSEEPLDLDNDFSRLLITNYEGTRTFYEPEHPDYWALDDIDKPYEFNGYWMASQLTSRIDGPGTGVALLESDSFGAGVQRFIGMQYATTYVPWHIFNNDEGDVRLADLVEGVDDIYFVADYFDYVSFTWRFPHYFDIDRQ